MDYGGPPTSERPRRSTADRRRAQRWAAWSRERLTLRLRRENDELRRHHTSWDSWWHDRGQHDREQHDREKSDWEQHDREQHGGDILDREHAAWHAAEPPAEGFAAASGAALETAAAGPRRVQYIVIEVPVAGQRGDHGQAGSYDLHDGFGQHGGLRADAAVSAPQLGPSAALSWCEGDAAVLLSKLPQSAEAGTPLAQDAASSLATQAHHAAEQPGGAVSVAATADEPGAPGPDVPDASLSGEATSSEAASTADSDDWSYPRRLRHPAAPSAEPGHAAPGREEAAGGAPEEEPLLPPPRRQPAAPDGGSRRGPRLDQEGASPVEGDPGRSLGRLCGGGPADGRGPDETSPQLDSPRKSGTLVGTHRDDELEHAAERGEAWAQALLLGEKSPPPGGLGGGCSSCGLGGLTAAALATPPAQAPAPLADEAKPARPASTAAPEAMPAAPGPWASGFVGSSGSDGAAPLTIEQRDQHEQQERTLGNRHRDQGERQERTLGGAADVELDAGLHTPGAEDALTVEQQQAEAAGDAMVGDWVSRYVTFAISSADDGSLCYEDSYGDDEVSATLLAHGMQASGELRYADGQLCGCLSARVLGRDSLETCIKLPGDVEWGPGVPAYRMGSGAAERILVDRASDPYDGEDEDENDAEA